MSYTIEAAIAPTEVVEVEVIAEDFDYNQVRQDWRRELIEDTDTLKAKAQQTLFAMLEMGGIAEKWKERLEYGLYGKWEKAKFPGAHATAQYCRAVYRKFNGLDSQLLTKFDAPAARALSAATAPPEALDRAIALAETGTQITERRAKLLLKGEVAVVTVGKEVTVRNPECKEFFGRKGTVVDVDTKHRILHIEDPDGEKFTILDTELYPSTKNAPSKQAVKDAASVFPPSFMPSADERRLEAMEGLVQRAIEFGEIILAVLPVHPVKNILREWLNEAKRYF